MAYIIPILAAVLPMAALVLLVVNYNKVDSPLYHGIVLAIVFAGLGFGLYNISPYSDLTNYMDQLMLTQGHTLQESLKLFSRGHMKDTPLAIVWFWLVGNTGNAQWYPASIAAVEFGIMGYLTADYAKASAFNRKQYAILLVLFIVAIPLFHAVTSVRSTPALAIGVLGFYLDFVKGKRNPLVYLLYVVAILIHSLGFILIPLRIICQIGVKRPGIAVALAAALLPLVYVLAGVLDPLFSKLGFSVIQKVQTYVSGGESEYAQHVTQSLYLQVKKWVSILFALVALYLQLQAVRETDDKTDRLQTRLGLLGCSLCATIVIFGVMITTPSYARFLYTATPIAVLMVSRRMLSGPTKLSLFDGNGKIRIPLNVQNVMILLFLALLAAGFALTLYDLPHRIDIGGLLWHVAFGFCGAFFV